MPPKPEVRENRLFDSKTSYDCLTVTTFDVRTVVKLLWSAENGVVTDSIISLARFVVKSTETATELYEAGVILPLINLLDHSDPLIVRFAGKIFSVLIRLREVADELAAQLGLAGQFASFLMHGTDEYLHEYSAVILAVLTLNKTIATELYDMGLMESVWGHIRAVADPDVLNASLIILRNLLHLKDAIDVLVNLVAFSLHPIVMHFQNPYIETQLNAVLLMKQIACISDERDLQMRIAEANCLHKLFEILENPIQTELYQHVLDILHEILGWDESVLYFIENEFLPRFLEFIAHQEDINMSLTSIDIIVHIANTDVGRHELYVQCIDKFLKKLLAHPSAPLGLRACRAISVMVKHPKAVKVFTDEESVETLMTLLHTHEGTEWLPDRAAVVECLNYLVWANPKVPEHLTTPPCFDILIATLAKNSIVMPPETFEQFVRIHQVFALCQEWATLTAKTRLLTTLDSLLDHDIMAVRVAILDILAAFLCEQTGVDWALEHNLHAKLMKYLDLKCVPLIYATVALINQLCKYPKVAYLFVKCELLPQMLSRTKEFEFFPVWQQTIDKLYSVHLPSKFNFLGRLDVTDITEDKFYVSRRKLDNFPVLEDLLLHKVMPIDIFYVSTFQTKKTPVLKLREKLVTNPKVKMMGMQVARSDSFINNHKYVRCSVGVTRSTCSLDGRLEMAEASSRASELSQMSEGSMAAKSVSGKKEPPKVAVKPVEKLCYRYRPLTAETKIRARLAGMERDTALTADSLEIPSIGVFTKIAPRLLSWVGRLPPDPYLSFYLHELRRIFEKDHCESDSQRPVYKKLICRIETLAHYTYMSTNGPTDDDRYLTDECQLHHLNKLKHKFGTNLIPLGFVRIGHYLERAMLFKVLADRLQIPCALMRGPRGKAWVEVPLIGAVVDPGYKRYAFEGPIVHYVVDLVENPGRLYPVGTSFAEFYCHVSS